MGRGFLDSMAADCLLAGRRDILCSGALQDVLRLANPIGIVAVHRQQNAPSLINAAFVALGVILLDSHPAESANQTSCRSACSHSRKCPHHRTGSERP